VPGFQLADDHACKPGTFDAAVCIARATAEVREAVWQIGGRPFSAWRPGTNTGSIRARRRAGYPEVAGAAGSRAGLDLPARRAVRAWLAGPGSPGGTGPKAGPAGLRDRRTCGGPRARRERGSTSRVQSPTFSALPQPQTAQGRCLTSFRRGPTRSNVWDAALVTWINAGASRPCRPCGSKLALRDRLEPAGVGVVGPSWRCWPAGPSRACPEVPGAAGSAGSRGNGLVCGHRLRPLAQIAGSNPLVILSRQPSTGEGVRLGAAPSGVPGGRSSTRLALPIRVAITRGPDAPRAPRVAHPCAGSIRRQRRAGMSKPSRPRPSNTASSGSRQQLRWAFANSEGGQQLRVIRQSMGAGTDESQVSSDWSCRLSMEAGTDSCIGVSSRPVMKAIMIKFGQCFMPCRHRRITDTHFQPWIVQLSYLFELGGAEAFFDGR